MTKAYWVMFALIAAGGCAGDKGGESGETGITTAGDDDDDDTTAPQVTSCDWGGAGLCFQHEDYAGAEQWCSDIQEQYNAYGWVMTFAPGPCPADSVYGCSLGGVTLADDIPVTAYYYSPDFDAASAETACTDAGGTGI